MRQKKLLAARNREAWEKAKRLAKKLPLLFPLCRIYLFGSLIDKHFTSYSDIDIALECQVEKNHLKAFTAAEKIARPFRVDVSAEYSHYPEENIYKIGEIIYEQGIVSAYLKTVVVLSYPVLLAR